ncbi:MAG TPA: hypothetical protein VHA52_03745 [Candidatus Babeliaceae bacterium]|nr:hypothetical protein [Candidatus Babeliaceae bacterium]
MLRIILLSLGITVLTANPINAASRYSKGALIGAAAIAGGVVIVGGYYGLVNLVKYMRPAYFYYDDATTLYDHLLYDYEEIIGAYDDLVKIYQEEQRILLLRPQIAASASIIFIPNAGGQSIERLIIDQLNKQKIMARMKLLRAVENGLERFRLPVKISWWSFIGWKFHYHYGIESGVLTPEGNLCTLENYKNRVQETTDELEAMQQELLRKEVYNLNDNKNLLDQTSPLGAAQAIHSSIALSHSSSWAQDPINVRLRRLSDALWETVRVLESMNSSSVSSEALKDLPILPSKTDSDFFQQIQ